MKHKDSIIFFDIETVSGHQSYNEIHESLQKQRERKAQRFVSEDQSIGQVYNDKAAIFAEFGKIVCISYGGYNADGEFTTHSFAWDDEKKILQDFFAMLDQFPHYILCGHNILEFDIPYCARRGIIHGLKLPMMIKSCQGQRAWNIKHIDTMELWKFGDYKTYTSLALLCEIFGITTPKDDIDGSQVSRVFREDQDVERIARYCEKDVVATAKVYEKLTSY